MTWLWLTHHVSSLLHCPLALTVRAEELNRFDGSAVKVLFKVCSVHGYSVEHNSMGQ